MWFCDRLAPVPIKTFGIAPVPIKTFGISMYFWHKIYFEFNMQKKKNALHAGS